MMHMYADNYQTEDEHVNNNIDCSGDLMLMMCLESNERMYCVTYMGETRDSHFSVEFDGRGGDDIDTESPFDGNGEGCSSWENDNLPIKEVLHFIT